ncbi:MAG: hypothetical protein SA339_05270 [Methanomassiliicoccus sp.]|nr:hypothetical protein [Methanomassiliicoccus sp.]
MTESELLCPVCGERLESDDASLLSSTMRTHFAASHGLIREAPAARADRMARARDGGAAPISEQPFSDSGLGMPISPDPSSLQTTGNPRAAAADTRRGLGSHQSTSSPGGKLSEGVDWLKGVMNLKTSTPTSTPSPPTSNLVMEKANYRLGMDDGMDVSPLRGDLGRQEDRDRLLLTGQGAGAVKTAPGMPPTVSSEVKAGEIGAECPVCGTIILSRQMEGLNRLMRDHMRSDHPQLMEQSLRV